MRDFAVLRLRLRSLFRSRPADSGLHAKLQYPSAQENLPRGRARQQARAVRTFENFAADLRYAARGLRKTPGIAAAVILSLALGIGANTAIFSAVEALMLRALPVEKPREIVQVQHWLPQYSPSWGWGVFPYAQFQLFRDQNQVFSGIAAATRRAANARIGSDPEAGKGAYVSPNFYELLGVRPWLGRVSASEDSAQAVLHYRFWRRVYNGDPSAVGRILMVDGNAYTIIGIAAPGFDGIDAGEPLDFTAAVKPSVETLLTSPNFYFQMVARLRPGISLAQAAADLNVIYSPILLEQNRRQAAQQIRPPEEWITVRPASSGIARLRDQYSRALFILMAITGAVLLIACLNVANLLLARATTRRLEIGVRLCLGAGRARIVSQMLTEAFALCLAGAAAGIVLAHWTATGLAAMMFTPQQPVEIDPHLDGRVLLFALAITALAGAIVGLIPALRATRVQPGEAVRDASPPGTGILRAGFLVLQVALSLVLVAGAELFVATLRNLETLDPGLRRDHVVIAQIDPGKAGYDAPRRRAFYHGFLDRLRQSPGVRSASLSAMAPLAGSQMATAIQSDFMKPGQDSLVAANLISADYLETMGTPLLRGRDFTPHDVSPDRQRVLVSESLARNFFAGTNPLGQILTLGKRRAEIIGIVKDARYTALRHAAPPTLYLDWMQAEPQNSRAFVEIYASDDARAAAALRDSVNAINANVPLSGITTFDRQIQASLVSERLMATISTLFGALALALAMIGLYGVLTCAVAQRTREIGIRMALEAGRRRVVSLVMRRVALTLAAGIVLGTAAALALGRFIAAQLYDVKPRDPWTFAISAALLALAAAIAAYLPARRAARVDPMIALRYE